MGREGREGREGRWRGRVSFHRANKLLAEREECEGGWHGGEANANRYREAKEAVGR